MVTLEQFNKIGVGKLPGHLGIVITHADESEIRAELKVNEALMAPNGFLHAGTVVTLADSLDAACRRRVVSPTHNMRP